MKEKKYYFNKIHKLLREEIRADLKCGLTKDVNDYLESCKNHFCMLQSGIPSVVGRFFGRTKKEVEQAQAMWAEIKLDMEGLIPCIIKGVKADEMKNNIRTVTAKSLIECAMAETGLQYRIFEQRYRAKIHIKITDASKLTFYLNYKKTPELLPSVIEAVKNIKKNISKLGKTAIVGRISSWDMWE